MGGETFTHSSEGGRELQGSRPTRFKTSEEVVLSELLEQIKRDTAHLFGCFEEKDKYISKSIKSK